MPKERSKILSYGPGMVHDLTSFDLYHRTPGSGDVVDAQGVQLEEVGGYTILDEKHPFFGIKPTSAYTHFLDKKNESEPFHFTAEGLAESSVLQCTLSVAPHANVTIIEHTHGQDLLIFSLILKIGEGATVSYMHESSEYAPRHLAIRRVATVEKNAKLTWFDTAQAENECTSETITCLVGEGAEAIVKSAILGKGGQLFDTFYHTIHEAAHTVSHANIRVLLDGHARHIGRAQTTILPHARQVKAREEMHTLLISPHAKSQTVPDLDIRENDVQCSHAVTTTRLSDEKLFYLCSRGLDRNKATSLTLEAHIAPALPPQIDPSLCITQFYP